MHFHEGTIMFFYHLESFITLGKVERHNTKGDIIKSRCSSSKKKATQSFLLNKNGSKVSFDLRVIETINTIKCAMS